MAVFATRDVDVALLDYNMPGKNGLELAGELRVTHPTMPIALITANVQDEVIARARAVDVTFVSHQTGDGGGFANFIAAAASRLRPEQK